jgi:hypothetical protein
VRWSLIYGPSHRILVDDILPDFARDLHDQARTIMATLPTLPVLE